MRQPPVAAVAGHVLEGRRGRRGGLDVGHREAPLPAQRHLPHAQTRVVVPVRQQLRRVSRVIVVLRGGVEGGVGDRLPRAPAPPALHDDLRPGRGHLVGLVHGLPPRELPRLLLGQHRQSGADVRVWKLPPADVARPAPDAATAAADALTVVWVLVHRAVDVGVGAERLGLRVELARRGGRVTAGRPSPVHHRPATAEARLRGRVHGADLRDGVDILHAAFVAHVEHVMAVMGVVAVVVVAVGVVGGGEEIVLREEVIVRPDGFVNLQRHN